MVVGQLLVCETTGIVVTTAFIFFFPVMCSSQHELAFLFIFPGRLCGAFHLQVEGSQCPATKFTKAVEPEPSDTGIIFMFMSKPQVRVYNWLGEKAVHNFQLHCH